MADVVCVGIMVADVVAKPVDVWPERGKLALVGRMELHTGGCAANTAVGLARIGIETGVIGRVGRDGFGDFIVRKLKREGVDTSGVVKDREALTSSTMVMVHGDGERSFLHYLGANAKLTAGDVKWDLVSGAEILHVAGAFLMPALDGEPTARLLQEARARGITTALDTGWDSMGNWMSVLAPVLPYVDIFLPSIEEARMLTGEEEPERIARDLVERGVGVVGLKMGERGCYLHTRAEAMAISAYKIDPVDATGAGDAFVAGFLTGVLRGWDLERTGHFANAVGALCTQAIGTTAGIKSLAETERFMANTPLRTNGVLPATGPGSV